jgi:hypothetical protein
MTGFNLCQRMALGFVVLVLGTVFGTYPSVSSPVPEAPIPTANISPSPNFLDSGACAMLGTGISCANPCVTSAGSWPDVTNDPSCTDYLLSAINNARVTLDEMPMALPSNWFSLSPPEQLFVLANLERIGLGYPPYLGLNATLSAAAQVGAQDAKDPNPAPDFRMGSGPNGDVGLGGAWSEGFSALEADYIWMYDDGWGGSIEATANIDCTSATAAGCWGHRKELLGRDPVYDLGVGLECTTCEMGAGYALVDGQGQWDDLLELPAGAPPAMTFTWASEVQYFATGYLAQATMTSPSSSTTPSILRAPATANVRKLILRPHFVKVSWSSPGTAGVVQVKLFTFKGSGCRTPVGGPFVDDVPPGDPSNGTISSRAPDWSDTRSAYSADVQVINASGSYVSSCVLLGRS